MVVPGFLHPHAHDLFHHVDLALALFRDIGQHRSFLPSPSQPDLDGVDLDALPDLDEVDPVAQPDRVEVDHDAQPDLVEVVHDAQPDLVEVVPNAEPDLVEVDQDAEPDLVEVDQDAEPDLVHVAHHAAMPDLPVVIHLDLSLLFSLVLTSSPSSDQLSSYDPTPASFIP